MQFDSNGIKVTLDRERISDKPCDYKNYFALPKGVKQLTQITPN
jgi:hypothetical protein